MNKSFHLITLAVCSLCGCIDFTEAAKILAVFPAPSKSHHILGEGLLVALHNRGHEVTMISPYKLAKPMANYTDIQVIGVKEYLVEQKLDMFENIFESKKLSRYNQFTLGRRTINSIANFTFEYPEVQKLLKSNAKFDVVICVVLFNEFLYGLAYHFDAIPIVMSTVHTNPMVNQLVGNPAHPAYHPVGLFQLPPRMNFKDRLLNFVITIVMQIYNRYHMFTQQKQYEQAFTRYGRPLPPLSDIVSNVSLVLVNSHHTTHFPRAYVPNMVQVGGLWIGQPKKLPKDILEFVESARDGVIYFCLGSNVRSADLPQHQRDGILKAFGKLTQKVLWKWEDENLPGKPENVLIKKWMPQQDILAHPNVKVFVSHGGLLSYTEAVHFGKPLIGIPILADQWQNLAQAQAAGCAIKIELEDLTEDTLTDALDEILTNPSYSMKAQVMSTIYHDEPEKPIDRAVRSVEYVIRHKGARFLRSASLDLNWAQLLMLDVIATLLVSVVAAVLIPYLLIRWVVRKVYKRTKKVDGRKKKN